MVAESSTSKFSKIRKLAALLQDGDAGLVLRHLNARISGHLPPLPATLAPQPRNAGEVSKPAHRDRPLLLAAGTSFRLDGAPISQFELLRGLKDRGWDILALAPADGPLRQRYAAHDIEARIAPAFQTEPTIASAYENDVAKLASKLSALGPDVVLASTIDSFPVIDAAHLAGIATVWNIRESEPWRQRLADRNPKIASRALACFQYAQAVIFVADSSMRNWGAFCSPDRAHIIYNAPAPLSHDDASRNSQYNEVFTRSASEKFLLSVGTVCDRKGQEDLIAALNLIPQDRLQSLKVLFIGAIDKTYYKKLEGMMTEAVRQQCLFLGVVHNPHDYIAESDVIISTSRSEAFPRIFLEAAQLKTPIIATPVDGAGERLKDSHSALFYQPFDARSLSEAIIRLVENPDLAAKLVKNAHRDLVEEWSHADMISAYDDILKQAISSPSV